MFSETSRSINLKKFYGNSEHRKCCTEKHFIKVFNKIFTSEILHYKMPKTNDYLKLEYISSKGHFGFSYLKIFARRVKEVVECKWGLFPSKTVLK